MKLPILKKAKVFALSGAFRISELYERDMKKVDRSTPTRFIRWLYANDGAVLLGRKDIFEKADEHNKNSENKAEPGRRNREKS